MQELPKTSGKPTFHRSDSEVERRREYLIKLERDLFPEARSILPGMITRCLDNDPSKRPTARDLIESLGMLL